MSDTANEKAALDWAERMDRGEIQFDPYLTSLATRVRDLGAENERLRAALGITGGNGDQTAALSEALAAAMARLVALEDGLRWFANVDMHAATHLLWSGAEFRAVPEPVAQEMIRARANARALLDGGTDGED